jgi:DNA-binding PadR family transcriptional regulator
MANEGGEGQRKAPIESPALFATGFVRLCILMFISEGPSHGYELSQRLAAAGMASLDRSGLYRALRTLESEGLVDSQWQTRRTGPPRRVYGLTQAGLDVLNDSMLRLISLQGILSDFLDKHFASSPQARLPVRDAGSPQPRLPSRDAQVTQNRAPGIPGRGPNPRGV